MGSLQLLVVLLLVSAGLQVIARRLGVPHPVLLVIGGLALAFIPGLPRIQIAPDTLFLVFVPPLLYWAALTTSLRDFRREVSAITRFATLVVLLTMTVVAIVAHWLTPEFTWAAAFVLGAIVAPPDPVAAIAVLRPLGAPRNLVTILEGEGLLNDATALVCYQFAVLAAVTGQFSATHAGVRLLLTGVGGIIVGLVIGWIIAFVQKHLIDRFPIVENTLSLLSPFFAYLPAEWLHVSGVLAVVALGLYLGRRGPRITGAATRVQAEATWTMVQFLLESLVFILIGLELPDVMRALRSHTLPQLVGYGALVTLAVVVVRIVYTVVAVSLLRFLARRKGKTGPDWGHASFIAWTGVRGGDSLVIALALPLTTATRAGFPARDLIIFITFSVIFATLVLQGLTLTPLLDRLQLKDDGEEDREESLARRAVAETGLGVIGHHGSDTDSAFVRRIRESYQERLKKWGARERDGRPPAEPSKGSGVERAAVSYRELRRRMISEERSTIVRLRDKGSIGDDVLRRIQRELDLETMMLDSLEEDAAEPYDEE